MRPGRPASHIKAKWIAWCKNGESTYYELDGKGNLIKSSDSDFIHETYRTDSNDKKKRTKRKSEVPIAESTAKEIQNPNELDGQKINKFSDDLFNEPFPSIIEDNNTLDFFHILDQLNENALFDQLFEF